MFTKRLVIARSIIKMVYVEKALFVDLFFMSGLSIRNICSQAMIEQKYQNKKSYMNISAYFNWNFGKIKRDRRVKRTVFPWHRVF